MTVRVRVPVAAAGTVSTVRTMPTVRTVPVSRTVTPALPVTASRTVAADRAMYVVAAVVAVVRVVSAVARTVGSEGDAADCTAVALFGVRAGAGPTRRKGGMLRCGHRPIIARTREALCSPRPKGR
ncbi:hypothetical protein GCM10010424_25930 [Streptomyces lienomycini]